jgi:hypothetical protein
MIHYFIYAKDYSFSTSKDEFYHENGLKTVQNFKNDVKKISAELSQSGKPVTQPQIIYLHWGRKCVSVDEEKIVNDYKKKIGVDGDTLPETIIQWIQENIRGDDVKIELLYIITDGQISSRSLDKCSELNSNMQYETVVFHAFNKDLDQIDLSVAASFLKSQCTIHRNHKLFDDTNISEEFDYDKINVDNFITERDNLKSYIRLKYINKFKQNDLALQEIDKLKGLRDRLFVELSLKLKTTDNDLNTMDKNVLLSEFVNTNWYKNLFVPTHDAKVEIEKSISTLINYIVSNKKSYAFDALKFDTQFVDPVKQEPIVDVNFKPEQEIQFPDIILDDNKGIPVVLLTKFNLLDKIIFHRTKTSHEVLPASFNKFRMTMECPLSLLKNPDISESIGYFYTLNVYKQLLKNTTKTEPRTRRPFHGGLVLVNTDVFDKYNDYILSATYFNSKKINFNVGLFYFVLWKNCENKEWMDRNVVEQFKKYAMRRISQTKCKIGLSALPLDPQENTSLLTALWYCVELSSCIFKSDSKNFAQERLRMYSGVAHYMVEILKYFNYDLDIESIEKRIDLIKNVMILKKIQNRTDKVYFLLKKIFRNDNGFLVSEIENPSNLNKLNYLTLNHKEMLPDDVIDKKVHLNKYVHLMQCVDDLDDFGKRKININMCEKTYRPYFTLDQNNSFYSDLVKISKKVVINNDDDKDKIKITYDAINSLNFDRVLSLYNLFINCVKDSGKYPTLAEYVEYISDKKKFKQNSVTIFASNFYISVQHVYADYQNIITTVDVNEFIKVCEKYKKRLERIKVEKVLEFSDDNEIDEFIAKEELKVNLIKK